MRHWIGIAALTAGVLTLASGCSLYRNDRCWMDDEQYLVARDLFVQTGSLDIVERKLNDYQWAACKVNEAVYRLEKEFEVLPEAALSAQKTESDTPAPAPKPAQGK